MELREFYEGKAFDAYLYFGAHREAAGYRFRLWAPGAQRVTVTGDFNSWTETPLVEEGRSGIFTLTDVSGEPGQLYKYCVYTKDGRRVEHCDPYGFGMELRPGACSILWDLDSYQFADNAWMEKRRCAPDMALNIYELHLGSWRRKEDGGWYSYEEIAQPLIDYVKENGYTHVEFLPLSEHPFDGSWGYQNTGFFAPTSRYGTPDQLKMLVDRCHQAGVGVIMDFVPVHFAVDSYGLREFSGEPLYEYPHRAVGESEWGSMNFIHSRREVACFLQSAANYWLREFHFDGLRMDAVSRLIYWQGDERRGQNGPAIEFLKTMNGGLKGLHPSALLIAEDSTTYGGTTRPVSEGGLGFDYKWDLGWMHDTLSYLQSGADTRPERYHQLTFSMVYFYNERHLLPLSHDEVVHGKASILQKMAGDLPDKFPQARALYLYMMTHPGKKLNFMGNELGQLREWSEERALDWELLKTPQHAGFHRCFSAMWNIYKEEEALHHDSEPENFRWIDCSREARCIYALERKWAGSCLVAVFNFSAEEQAAYTFTMAGASSSEILLFTDWEAFGGETVPGKEKLCCKPGPEGCAVTLTLPPFSGILLRMNDLESNTVS